MLKVQKQTELVSNAVNSLEKHGYAILERVASTRVMDNLAAELKPHFDQLDVALKSILTKRVHSRVLVDATELQRRMIEPCV